MYLFGSEEYEAVRERVDFLLTVSCNAGFTGQL